MRNEGGVDPAGLYRTKEGTRGDARIPWGPVESRNESMRSDCGNRRNELYFLVTVLVGPAGSRR